MSGNIRLKANLLVCAIVITGFAVIAAINYKTNRSVYMDNIERMSALTSDGIRYRLEALFAKPVNISLTMAASPLLAAHLQSETAEEDEAFTQTLRTYLNAFKEKYSYDSVFLVSAKTKRYYTPFGIDRILDEAGSENTWYYRFLDSSEDYSLNIDNDEAAQDDITVFVNCRISDGAGATLGVVGVGLRIVNLQVFLEEYARENGADIYLLGSNGDIEIAADNNGFQPVNFFDVCGYPQYKDEILKNSETREALTWWLTEESERNYVVAQYIPGVNWHLIVEHNTVVLGEQMNRQFVGVAFAAVITGLLVMIAVTFATNTYNKRIIALTAAVEQEKRAHLVRLAQLDGLTDVYNKAATEHHIEHMLHAATEKIFAFFIIDIDYFKQINDTHGHAFGDFAITRFAAIIKGCFRDGDVVGRIGGDEFAVFLPVPGVDWASKKAAELKTALDAEIADGDTRCNISASIGVATTAKGGADFETLYKNADAALYETKRCGRNGYTIYDGHSEEVFGV